MRQFIITALFLLHTLCSFAQSAADTVVYVPAIAYWSLNDTFSFSVERKTMRFDDEGMPKDSTVQQFDFSLIVVDSTDTSYTIRVLRQYDWNELAMIYSKTGLQEQEVTELMGKQSCQHLEYVIDQNGAFKEVKNLEELAASIKAVTYAMVDKKLSGERATNAKKMQDKLLQPAILQQKLIRELVAMHGFYGLEYRPDSLLVYDSEEPNGFAPGQVITFHNRMMLDIPDPETGVARIEFLNTIDGESAMALVKGYVSGTAGEKELLESLKETPPRYEIYTQFLYDMEYGFPLGLYYERTGFMGDKKVEVYSWRME